MNGSNVSQDRVKTGSSKVVTNRANVLLGRRIARSHHSKRFPFQFKRAKDIQFKAHRTAEYRAHAQCGATCCVIFGGIAISLALALKHRNTAASCVKFRLELNCTVLTMTSTSKKKTVLVSYLEKNKRMTISPEESESELDYLRREFLVLFKFEAS